MKFVHWGEVPQPSMPPHILGALRGCPTDGLVSLHVGSEPKLQSGLPLREATGLIREKCQSYHFTAAAIASHHSCQGIFINRLQSLHHEKSDNFGIFKMCLS